MGWLIENPTLGMAFIAVFHTLEIESQFTWAEMAMWLPFMSDYKYAGII